MNVSLWTLINFMDVIYTESIGEIRVLTTLTAFSLLLCQSDSLSLSAPLAALSIRVAITVSSLTAFSTTRVSINSDIRILTFRHWSDFNSQTFGHLNAKITEEFYLALELNNFTTCSTYTKHRTTRGLGQFLEFSVYGNVYSRNLEIFDFTKSVSR